MKTARKLRWAPLRVRLTRVQAGWHEYVTPHCRIVLRREGSGWRVSRLNNHPTDAWRSTLEIAARCATLLAALATPVAERTLVEHVRALNAGASSSAYTWIRGFNWSSLPAHLLDLANLAYTDPAALALLADAFEESGREDYAQAARALYLRVP